MNRMSPPLWTRIGVTLAILPALLAAAKSRKSAPAAEAKDSIEVIAHLPLAHERAVNLLLSTHWRRNYLYVEHGAEGAVTVVDVTDPRTPKATRELAPPSGGPPHHIEEVQGAAALFTTGPVTPEAPASETVTIVNFDDPEHPRLVRQFSHVACMRKDVSRGLIYLVNDEGLWVLQTRAAPDRELEEQYDRNLKYNH